MQMATVRQTQPFDLAKPATWQVTIGRSITKKGSRNGLRALQYNYLPDTSSPATSTRHISSDTGRGTVDARIHIDGQEYGYSGLCGPATGHYVLILGDRKKEGARLERLDTEQVLNLNATPGGPDEKALHLQHPQLDLQLNMQHNERSDEENGERENPFDYHNLMESMVDELPMSTAASTSSTPLVKPARSSADPRAISDRAKPSEMSARKKRRMITDEELPSKRVKPDTTQSVDARAIPSVKLSRKASLRPGDEIIHDSGELVIEDEPVRGRSTSESYKPHSSMSLALSGQFGNGPRSLHSAASSPGSPLSATKWTTSPADRENVAFGSLSDGQDGGDEQEDADIDELELPSPVQDRQQVSLPVAADDEDDDLSKELERAMAEQDEQPEVHQSEEESEEE